MSETYDVAMRDLKASRMNHSTKVKLFALLPHQFHKFNFAGDWGLSYHKCRFCSRGYPEIAGLWKYAVRHYCCNDCRKAAIENL
jgi:hypothetical protein